MKNIHMRDWLRIFRAQTALATLLLMMTGYLLGGGEFFSVWKRVTFAHSEVHLQLHRLTAYSLLVKVHALTLLYQDT